MKKIYLSIITIISIADYSIGLQASNMSNYATQKANAVGNYVMQGANQIGIYANQIGNYASQLNPLNIRLANEEEKKATKEKLQQAITEDLAATFAAYPSDADSNVVASNFWRSNDMNKKEKQNTQQKLIIAIQKDNNLTEDEKAITVDAINNKKSIIDLYLEIRALRAENELLKQHIAEQN